jgi:hypothetical protein
LSPRPTIACGALPERLGRLLALDALQQCFGSFVRSSFAAREFSLRGDELAAKRLRKDRLRNTRRFFARLSALVPATRGLVLP